MGTEKRQILIVDDVELNRAILAELFQDSYEVLEAENGCQALELLEAHHDAILIVLLDIIMPGYGRLRDASEHGPPHVEGRNPRRTHHLRKFRQRPFKGLRTRRFGHHQQAVQSEYRQATRRQHHRTLPAQAPS